MCIPFFAADPHTLFAGLAPQPRDKGGKEETNKPEKKLHRCKAKAAPTPEGEGTMNGIRKNPSGDFKGRRLFD